MSATSGKIQIQKCYHMVPWSNCASFIWVDSTLGRVENAGEMIQWDFL